MRTLRSKLLLGKKREFLSTASNAREDPRHRHERKSLRNTDEFGTPKDAQDARATKHRKTPNQVEGADAATRETPENAERKRPAAK